MTEMIIQVQQVSKIFGGLRAVDNASLEVAAGRIAERFEKMEEHLRGHVPDLLPLERSIPYDPVPSSKINQYLGFRFIHRKCIAISFHSSFIRKAKIECSGLHLPTEKP